MKLRPLLKIMQQTEKLQILKMKMAECLVFIQILRNLKLQILLTNLIQLPSILSKYNHQTQNRKRNKTDQMKMVMTKVPQKKYKVTCLTKPRIQQNYKRCQKEKEKIMQIQEVFHSLIVTQRRTRDFRLSDQLSNKKIVMAFGRNRELTFLPLLSLSLRHYSEELQDLKNVQPETISYSQYSQCSCSVS